jgi:hypothetical protein
MSWESVGDGVEREVARVVAFALGVVVVTSAGIGAVTALVAACLIPQKRSRSKVDSPK